MSQRLGSNLDLSFSSLPWQSTDKECLSWLPVLLITIIMTHSICGHCRHCAGCFLQIIWCNTSLWAGCDKRSQFRDLETEMWGFLSHVGRKRWGLVLHPGQLSTQTPSQLGSLGSDKGIFKIEGCFWVFQKCFRKSSKLAIVESLLQP